MRVYTSDVEVDIEIAMMFFGLNEAQAKEESFYSIGTRGGLEAWRMKNSVYRHEKLHTDGVPLDDRDAVALNMVRKKGWRGAFEDPAAKWKVRQAVWDADGKTDWVQYTRDTMNVVHAELLAQMNARAQNIRKAIFRALLQYGFEEASWHTPHDPRLGFRPIMVDDPYGLDGTEMWKWVEDRNRRLQELPR